jgi:hypothetical protein
MVDLGRGLGRGDGLGNRFRNRFGLDDGDAKRAPRALGGLRDRLGGGLGLRLDLPDQALAVGLAPDTVRLGVLDRGGMALHADAERQREVEGLLVGEAELSCELVDADLPGQVPCSPFSRQR